MFSVKLISLLSSFLRDPPVCFYPKEFVSPYKFTPFACFLVKYLVHYCVMIISLVPLPFACGWCGHPVFNAIGQYLFNPGCTGGQLSATDPGGPIGPLPVLFDTVTYYFW